MTTQHENELAVITVATKSADYFQALLQSCQRYNIQPVVLGMGSPWTGFCMKFNQVYHHITQANPLPFTLFVDGLDSVFQSGVTEIMESYKKFKTPLVVSGDVYCWPDASIWRKYPEAPTRLRYVNSGGYMGPTDVLIKILESMGCPFANENQEDGTKLTNYFLSHLDEVGIDYHAEIFQPLCGAEDLVELRAGGGAYIKRGSGKRPHILHLNGHVSKNPSYAKNLGYTL